MFEYRLQDYIGSNIKEPVVRHLKRLLYDTVEVKRSVPRMTYSWSYNSTSDDMLTQAIQAVQRYQSLKVTGVMNSETWQVVLEEHHTRSRQFIRNNLGFGMMLYYMAQSREYAEVLTVGLNIIFDKGRYSATQKEQFKTTSIKHLEECFAQIGIKFSITYNEGTASQTADHNKHEMTSGVVANALNVFATPGSVGPSNEVTNHRKGEIWLSTNSNADVGNLTHGTIHALGIVGGSNDYDAPANTSSNIYYLILSELGTRLTGNSAESATEKIHAHLRILARGGYSNVPQFGDYYAAKTGLRAKAAPVFKKEIKILREGARRYSK